MHIRMLRLVVITLLSERTGQYHATIWRMPIIFCSPFTSRNLTVWQSSVMNKNKSKLFVTYLPRLRFGESHHKVRSFDVTMSVFMTMNVLQSINLISTKHIKGLPMFLLLHVCGLQNQNTICNGLLSVTQQWYLSCLWSEVASHWEWIMLAKANSQVWMWTTKIAMF